MSTIDPDKPLSVSYGGSQKVNEDDPIFDIAEGSLDYELYSPSPILPLSELHKLELLDKAPNFLQLLGAKIASLFCKIFGGKVSKETRRILEHGSLNETVSAAKKIEETRALLALSKTSSEGPFQITPLTAALARGAKAPVKVSQKEIARANISYAQKTLEIVPNFKSVTGRDYIPYSMNKSGAFSRSLTPTSQVTLHGQERSGLTSVLVRERKDQELTISCGVISTERKAKEFVALINKQRDEGKIDPNKQLIISIHQLNSFLGESDLINKEHEMVKLIKEELKKSEWKDPIILHSNHGMQFTTQLPDFMEKDCAEKFNKEVARDYRNIATEMSSNKTTPLSQKKAGLRAQRERLTKLAGQDIKASKDLLLRRNEITAEIAALDNELKILDDKLKVVNGLIDAYESGKYTPATEVQIELLLDRFLGIHSVINCKSGLDRTGLVRSLAGALDHMIEKEGLEFTAKFVLHQEENLAAYNALEEQGKLPSTLNKEERAIHDFKRDFFLELQNVGIPLTIFVTGVGGFKMSYGLLGDLLSNPHILPFMPRFAVDPEGNTQSIVQGGTLTPYGVAMLQAESDFRG